MADDAPEWAKREIQEAIRILKEDGLHVHKTYKAFLDSQKTGDNGDHENTEGEPPPENSDNPKPPKKPGLWWGNRE